MATKRRRPGGHASRATRPPHSSSAPGPLHPRPVWRPWRCVQRAATSSSTRKVMPDVVLIATGSEVELAVMARAALAELGVGARVVSLPSWEIFDAQGPDWKATVLGAEGTPRVSVEAGSTLGWDRYTGANWCPCGHRHVWRLRSGQGRAQAVRHDEGARGRHRPSPARPRRRSRRPRRRIHCRPGNGRHPAERLDGHS